MDIWRRWLSDPSTKLLVAEEEGRPVGIMAVKLREEGREAFLCAARVHPAHRRKGGRNEARASLPRVRQRSWSSIRKAIHREHEQACSQAG